MSDSTHSRHVARAQDLCWTDVLGLGALAIAAAIATMSALTMLAVAVAVL